MSGLAWEPHDERGGDHVGWRGAVALCVAVVACMAFWIALGGVVAAYVR